MVPDPPDDAADDPTHDPAYVAALDELYEADPQEFVLTRARLERGLRDEGHTHAAAALRRLRRPSLGVWAVNRVARHDPDAVHELVDATERVRAAQQAMLQGGSADDLRDEVRERQSIVETLVRAGTQALADHAPKPASYRDDIANLLEAASLDSSMQPTLLAGRLARALPPPIGFDALQAPATPLSLVPDGATRKDTSRSARKELDSARRDVDGATNRAGDAERAAEDADAEATSAQIAADTARSRVADVEQALARAKEEERTAARYANETRQRADAARRSAAEHGERLRRAQERLHELEQEDG